jgi:hypothetical protein
MRPRRVEARAKGLPVGVDIREYCQPHAFLRSRFYRPGLRQI